MLKKGHFFYSTGRRKTSSARVFLQEGSGLFLIKSSKNPEPSKKFKHFTPLKDYFTKLSQQRVATAPLEALNLKQSFDVFVSVKGGGFTGQAEAIRHGLARAFLKLSKDHRPILKQKGFLTRDSRMVERKKYGRHKARKSTQFSKR